VTPLYTIAALLLVAGLAMTAPPSFSSGSDDHFGVVLHPLFPHVHGVFSRLAVDDGERSDFASQMPRVEQKPGISAPSADSGGRDAVAGIVLPLLLASLAIEAGRRRLLPDLMPEQRAFTPPLPPPRLPLIVG
jgi:hypothetical protein